MPITSRATLDQLTAWKLVTKRLSRDKVLAELPAIQVTGDAELGAHVLDAVSMIA